MADTVEKRKLSELRVVDLKQELEKRGKDGNGVKNVLIDRLTQALKDEKIDPETYEFEVNVTGKTPAKKGKSSSKAEEDAASSAAEEGDLNIAEMVVQDECNEGESAEAKKNSSAEKLNKDKEAKKEVPNEQPKEETSNGAAAAATTETDKSSKDETKEADNEDSLNLTIGEEDEKLLHDDSNIESEKKGADAEKSSSDSKKADPSDESAKDDKVDSSSEKTAVTKDDKESAGKSSSSSSAKSSDSKVKSSPSSSEKTSTVSRNLWVSGLSSLTRATDLKLIFSKYGKVIGAKVVTNTRTPGTRCYGYVTMASAKDATECITHLHRTELHGRMISVERAKSDLGPAKSSSATNGSSSTSKTEAPKTTTPAEVVESGKEKEKDKTEKKEDNGSGSHRSRDRGRSNYRSRSQYRSRSEHRGKSMEKSDKPKDGAKKDDTQKVDGKDGVSRKDDSDRRRDNRTTDHKDNRNRDRDREVLSLQKIREERERQRLREKERQLREEERRRREIRQRQREEEQLLRREREKLALERARIEKEKAELLRIERERQKLEREKIELERLELKRQQRKIEEAKRNLKRPATTTDHYEDDRKRSTGSDRRFEAPPPPSISVTGRGTYSAVDKKRLDDYVPPKRDDYKSREPRSGPVDDYRRDSFKRNGGGGVLDDYSKRDMDRPSMTSMESRYQDARSAGNDYRGSGGPRDDRDRNGTAPKSRYMDPMDQRYSDRSGSGAGGGSSSGPWNSGPQQMSMAAAGLGNDGWRMDNGQDRYDRTYNERKAPQMSANPFMDPSRQSQFMGGGSSGGRPQDRYGAPVSGRFDNGRY